MQLYLEGIDPSWREPRCTMTHTWNCFGLNAWAGFMEAGSNIPEVCITETMLLPSLY